jgi:hypothetical protein
MGFRISSRDGNGGAAATLIAKMLPPEQPPEKLIGPAMIVNVHSVDVGQQFSPGGPDERVLMPFDELDACWAAYNGGRETWATYLQGVEGHLTRKSFENLSRVPPLERAKFLPNEAPALLQLVPKAPEAPEAGLDRLEVDFNKKIAALEVEFNGLSREQMLARANRILEAMDPSGDNHE